MRFAVAGAIAVFFLAGKVKCNVVRAMSFDQMGLLHRAKPVTPNQAIGVNTAASPLLSGLFDSVLVGQGQGQEGRPSGGGGALQVSVGVGDAGGGGGGVRGEHGGSLEAPPGSDLLRSAAGAGGSAIDSLVDTGFGLGRSLSSAGHSAARKGIDAVHKVVQGAIGVGEKIVKSGVRSGQRGLATIKGVLERGVSQLSNGLDVQRDVKTGSETDSAGSDAGVANHQVGSLYRNGDETVDAGQISDHGAGLDLSGRAAQDPASDDNEDEYVLNDAFKQAGFQTGRGPKSTRSNKVSNSLINVKPGVENADGSAYPETSPQQTGPGAVRESAEVSWSNKQNAPSKTDPAEGEVHVELNFPQRQRAVEDTHRRDFEHGSVQTGGIAGAAPGAVEDREDEVDDPQAGETRLSARQGGTVTAGQNLAAVGRVSVGVGVSVPRGLAGSSRNLLRVPLQIGRATLGQAGAARNALRAGVSPAVNAGLHASDEAKAPWVELRGMGQADAAPESAQTSRNVGRGRSSSALSGLPLRRGSLSSGRRGSAGVRGSSLRPSRGGSVGVGLSEGMTGTRFVQSAAEKPLVSAAKQSSPLYGSVSAGFSRSQEPVLPNETPLLTALDPSENEETLYGGRLEGDAIPADAGQDGD